MAEPEPYGIYLISGGHPFLIGRADCKEKAHERCLRLSTRQHMINQINEIGLPYPPRGVKPPTFEIRPIKDGHENHPFVNQVIRVAEGLRKLRESQP